VIVKTEFSCPTCKRTTGTAVQVVANMGKLSCPKGHTWADTADFYSENPIMEFKVEIPKNLPQQNYAPLTISVPLPLKQHLEATYGEKLSATVAAVLSQLSVNSMVISDGDLQRLAERLGARPKNSSELVGLIYSKTCETDDAKQERDIAVKDLKAYEGMSPGRIVIDLSDQLVTAQTKAQDAALPVKVWCERVFTGALRDNWF
jgi:hypothetical protein